MVRIGSRMGRPEIRPAIRLASRLLQAPGKGREALSSLSSLLVGLISAALPLHAPHESPR